MLRLLVIVCYTAIQTAAISEAQNGAARFQEHFHPDAYGAYPQNWSVEFGVGGLVYIANRDGVLQFDGQDWTLVRVANNSTVRSLAAGPDGRIYVGAQGEFGYLAPGVDGGLGYVSLVPRLPAGLHDFTDVWSIHVASYGVFFQTRKYLFLIGPSGSRHWVSRSGFHTMHGLGDSIFVRENGVGLQQFTGSGFALLKGGEVLSDIRIGTIQPTSQSELLIVTRDSGLFVYKNGLVSRFDSPANSVLSQANVYSGCLAGDGSILLATLSEGVMLLSPDGRLLSEYGSEQGIPDRVVNFVARSARGELWIALNSLGISRVEYGGPVTVFDTSHGLEGTINHITRVGSRLFVATASGLFWKGDSDRSFERVPGIPRSWSLAGDGSTLLVGSDEGLFALDLATLEIELIAQEQSFVILRSTRWPTNYFIGLKSGLMRVDNTTNAFAISYLDLGTEVRSIVEDDHGDLWLGTRNDGLRALEGGKLVQGIATPFVEGMNGERVSALRVLDQVHFVTQEGRAFTFDDRRKRIVPSTLHALLGSYSVPNTIRFGATDSRGLGWLVLPNAVVQVWTHHGSYRLMERPALRFDGIVQARIAVEESGVAWISRGDELFRYDPNVVKDYDVPFNALIRKVVDSRTDSVLFGGNYRSETGGFSLHQLKEDIPSLGYEFNNLRFRFAAPTFNGSEQTLYQYRLVGRTQEWSEWSRTSTVAFSGLSEGSYTFQVRAKNVLGFTSEVGSYSFHLLPPWFRTWWAYSIYVLSLVTVTVLSWKYITMVRAHRVAREQARELARERVVNERLNEANAQLHVANERLTKVNNLKDEFLATTSHELRTPITAILGYASILKEEVPGDYHEFVEIIEKSGARLMDTLNSLLDLAELRAGTVELTVDELDVGSLLVDITAHFDRQAEEKGLSLELNIPNRPIQVRSDRRLIEKAVRILIGNAIKFTENGSVVVSASRSVDRLRLSVSDTGEGIDEEFLPLLFDEFQQESGGLARSHGGNGLGLAIAAKLVELLQGTIDVESKKGVGSTFSVILPVELVAGEKLEERLETVESRFADSSEQLVDAHRGTDEEAQLESERDSIVDARDRPGESGMGQSSTVPQTPTSNSEKRVFEQDRPAVAKKNSKGFDRRHKRSGEDNRA